MARDAWVSMPSEEELRRFIPAGSPTKVVERDWQPLRDLGFDDADCLEVAHIVGIFNHLTRLADGFGLQLDSGTQEASRTAIPLQRASNRISGDLR